MKSSAEDFPSSPYYLAKGNSSGALISMSGPSSIFPLFQEYHRAHRRHLACADDCDVTTCCPTPFLSSSRLDIKLILFGFLAALMVPRLYMVVPKYVILKRLPLFGWNLLEQLLEPFGSLPGLNAFNILLLKTFFDGIPDDPVDAATIDGPSRGTT